MSKNRISILQNDSVNIVTNLRILDLSLNDISWLDGIIFRAVSHSLEDLYLNRNSITVDDLPENVVGQVERLKVLQIHCNRWENSSHGNIFSSIVSLEKISMDGLPNATFNNTFSINCRLGRLHIYGAIDIIKNNTFRGVEICPITELVIKATDDLFDVEPNAFSSPHHLQTLDLSYNTRQGFANLSKSWFELSSTNITTLILTNIVPRNQQTVVWSGCSLLGRMQIKSLSLDKNNIVQIDGGFYENLPNLEYLTLAYNRLSYV